MLLLLPIEEKRAKERFDKSLPKEGEKGFQKINVRENFPSHNEGKSIDIVASKGNISGKTLSKAKKIKNKKLK